MVKREQKFQTAFNKWLLHNWPYTTAFELKVARDGRRIPLREIKSHQLHALKRARQRLVYKFPDGGLAGTPFDCFMMVEGRSYVVLNYLGREFYMIEPETIEDMAKRGEIASITEETAKKVSFFTSSVR